MISLLTGNLALLLTGFIVLFFMIFFLQLNTCVGQARFFKWVLDSTFLKKI